MFVSSKRNWRAIESVADELLKFGYLTGEEVALLVEIADGTREPRALEAYRDGIKDKLDGNPSTADV